MLFLIILLFNIIDYRENRKGQRTIISRCKQISQVAKLDNLLSTGDIKNNKDKGAKEVSLFHIFLHNYIKICIIGNFKISSLI